jgi:hypothetical protein
VVLGKANPNSDVELALVDEQWSLDVFLNNERVVAYLDCVVIALFFGRARLGLFIVALLLGSFWIVFFFVSFIILSRVFLL